MTVVAVALAPGPDGARVGVRGICGWCGNCATYLLGDVAGGSDYEAAVLADTLLRDSGVAHMANTALGRVWCE